MFTQQSHALTMKHHAVLFYFSYSIMKDCWADDKESRPTFHELKETFDGLISHDVRYQYLRLGSLLSEVGLLAPPVERLEEPSHPAASIDCEQQVEILPCMQ